jgi:Zn-dependent M32 family carboxypeptidase
MASVEMKSYFEEVLQEELTEDKGRVTKELVKTDWNQFSQVMSKALDLQQKSSKKREDSQSPYGLSAHTGPPAMGGGRPQ